MVMVFVHGVVQLWDTRTWQPLRSLDLAKAVKPLQTGVFSVECALLVSWQSELRLLSVSDAFCNTTPRDLRRWICVRILSTLMCYASKRRMGAQVCDCVHSHTRSRLVNTRARLLCSGRYDMATQSLLSFLRPSAAHVTRRSFVLVWHVCIQSVLGFGTDTTAYVLVNRHA